jgi:hypothetical protein
MTGNRLADFLEQMQLAGTSALAYVDGIDKAAFFYHSPRNGMTF